MRSGSIAETSHRPREASRGFTLIETLVYLGLLSFLIIGILASSYYIIQGSNKVREKIMVETEADFLLKKISWAISGLPTITAPSIGTTGLSLTAINSHISPNPFTFDLDSATGQLRMTHGSGPAKPLNSVNVAVSNLSFQYVPAAGTRPPAILTSFRVNNQQYSQWKYFRK